MHNKHQVIPNLQLWITKVGSHSLNTEQSIIPLLSPSEQHRFNITKNINKRREFLLSRALMRHALSQLFSTHLSDWVFIYRHNSPPIINNLPDNTFISLSHSNGFIIFAISMFPIGVDIELVKDKKNLIDLAEIFMSKKERNLLKNYNINERIDNFYRVWCAKEAYYKANTSEHQSKLKLNEVSILSFMEGSKDWSLIEGNIDQCLFSTVVKNGVIPISRENHTFLMQESLRVIFNISKSSSM